MIRSEDFIPLCGCRSAGECSHGAFADARALDAMVDAFASAMKRKLRQKATEGWYGWDDRRRKTDISIALKGHVDRGSYQWVDVANLAAMLWNMEQPDP